MVEALVVNDTVRPGLTSLVFNDKSFAGGRLTIWSVPGIVRYATIAPTGIFTATFERFVIFTLMRTSLRRSPCSFIFQEMPIWAEAGVVPQDLRTEFDGTAFEDRLNNVSPAANTACLTCKFEHLRWGSS